LAEHFQDYWTKYGDSDFCKHCGMYESECPIPTRCDRIWRRQLSAEHQRLLATWDRYKGCGEREYLAAIRFKLAWVKLFWVCCWLVPIGAGILVALGRQQGRW